MHRSRTRRVKPSLISRTPIEEKVVVSGKSPRHGGRLAAIGCLLAALLFAPAVSNAQDDPDAARRAAAAIEAAEDALPPKHVALDDEDDEPCVLFNYGVLTTGFDAPKTSAAIIARPTKSLVLYSQMVGRIIRGEKVDGTKEAEIWTVVDQQLPGFRDISEAFWNWEDVW